MDAQTAPLASSEPEGAKATGRSVRQLWQVPVFLLGVAVLVMVWVHRPCAGDCNTYQLQRELTSARHQLAHNNPEAAIGLVQKVLEQADCIPDRVGEAHFLWGSAELCLVDPANVSQATAHYQAALQHLELADQHGVPESDRPHLLYRLARAGLFTGVPPQNAIAYLSAAAEQLGEDKEKVDAYSLLTQAYLRLPQPDLKGALAANEKLRRLPLLSADVLERAKLLGGELKLQMNRPDDARKDREKINQHAPLALLTRARVLLGRTYQMEGNWSEAAQQWDKALSDPPESLAERGLILYQLGLCYRRMEQLDQAARVWEECYTRHPGEQAQAAAVALADLYLQQGKNDKGLELLAVVGSSVPNPEAWKNSLIALAQVREVFDRGCQALRKAQSYDLAARLIGSYQTLAEPGRGQRLLADISADWGQARLAIARGLESEAQAHEEQAARDLLTRAGAAYVQTELLPAPPAEQAATLWRAITCYRDARDNNQVITLMTQFLNLIEKDTDPRAGEAYFLLGETFRQEKNIKDARDAYLKCMQYGTPFVFRARYQLAVQAIEEGNLDDAKDLLEQNISQLYIEGGNEVKQETYFTLGSLFFQRHNYQMVVRRLEQVLGTFPSSPETTRARYQLAESYRQLAAQENQNYLLGEYKDPETRAHYWKQYRVWLAKAADEFYELAQSLEKLGDDEARRHLTAEELLQIPFIAAECRFNLGDYEGALKIYEALAKKMHERPEGLNALGGMVRCHSALSQPEQVKQRLMEIRLMLNGMDGAIRQQWEAWLTVAGKQAEGHP